MYYRHITFGGGCHWLQDSFWRRGLEVLPRSLCTGRNGTVAKGQWAKDWSRGEWTRHCSIIPFETTVLQRLSLLSLGGTQYIPGTESSTDGMRKKERGAGMGEKESIPTFKFPFSLSQELRRSLLEHYHANQISRQKLFKCFSCSCLDVDIIQNPCLNLITVL